MVLCVCFLFGCLFYSAITVIGTEGKSNKKEKDYSRLATCGPAPITLSCRLSAQSGLQRDVAHF